MTRIDQLMHESRKGKVSTSPDWEQGRATYGGLYLQQRYRVAQ